MKNEVRIIAAADLRCSPGAMGSDMRISGIAARYGIPTKIGTKAGKFVERIMRGAFSRALDTKQDIALLINHDPNRLMARVSSGTLRLRDMEEGLSFEADLDSDSEDARNAYRSIQRGDMHGCSFSFDPDCVADWDADVDPDDRSVKMPRRTIRSFKIVNDVSAVTFPAYRGTSVVARSVHYVEQRSNIIIPAEFVFVPEPVVDSEAVRARRRNLLNIASL